MIVSHEHRFIFVKTHKTAGTSIEIALSKFLGPADVVSPVSPRDEGTRRELGYPGPRNTLVPFRKYTRADWTRALRHLRPLRFFNHMPARRIRHYVGEEVWNDYFVFSFERNPFDKAISRYFWRTRRFTDRPSLADYFRGEQEALLTDWPLYTIGGKVAVDFMGRFERLTDDLEVIRRRIGLPEPLVLPRAKGGQRQDRRHYSEFLTPSERALIERVCARELEAFGYTYEEAQRA